MMFAVSTAVVAILSCATEIASFTPSLSFARANIIHKMRSQMSMVDATVFHDIPQHIDSMQSAFSSLLLSDEGISAAVDVVSTATTPAIDAAAEVVTTDPGNGWFGFLEGPIEGLLQLIHTGFVSIGVASNAWGVSIIILTLVIKLGTYPLTKSQLESTSKMQMLQPTIKGIQAKYASNPEIMNQKVAEVYKTEEVNPLAGCLPAIVQLPVFIGLYRAVLTLAKENKLDEPFLWLPNLEGPTYGADPSQGSQWLLSGWVDGVPSLGWEATIAFLTIPVFLVISQSISQKLMQPKNQTDEQAAQANNIVIKLLPLLIGWFSLNVPAALGIYWVANNIITTALTVQIRSVLDANPPTLGGGGGATAAVMDAPVSTFTPAPLREKPPGFASAAGNGADDVTPITPMDAEVVESNTGNVPMAPASPSKKKRKGKKKKRN